MSRVTIDDVAVERNLDRYESAVVGGGSNFSLRLSGPAYPSAYPYGCEPNYGYNYNTYPKFNFGYSNFSRYNDNHYDYRRFDNHRRDDHRGWDNGHHGDNHGHH